MHRAAAYLLASVWFSNGFGAKVAGLVPRHRLIVARFFGDGPAPAVTRLVGLAEIAMAAWILSGAHRPLCALAQAAVVATMNSLEYWRARDLLLFPVLMPVANAALLAVAFLWGFK
ncbi:MAG TPA: DoxX-like family protein [Elusimicrobiota bacterium]|nr:DoxX-like family protein [Elusimicrobiota bacterium]